MHWGSPMSGEGRGLQDAAGAWTAAAPPFTGQGMLSTSARSTPCCGPSWTTQLLFQGGRSILSPISPSPGSQGCGSVHQLASIKEVTLPKSTVPSLHATSKPVLTSPDAFQTLPLNPERKISHYQPGKGEADCFCSSLQV